MATTASIPWPYSDMSSDVAKNHMVPGEHCYDGVWYCGVFPARALDRVKSFDFHDDDTILVSFPKSGTQWMTKILKLMLNIKKDSVQDKALKYLEIETPSEHGPAPARDLIQALPDPRTFSSHLGAVFYKTPLEGKRTKFVVVLRNVKDVLVSYYHFYRSCITYGRFPGTFDDFMEMVKAGRVRDWFDWVLGWWGYKDHPNVIIIKYESLKRNFNGEIRRLAAFLGRELSTDDIESICEQTSFPVMEQEIGGDPNISKIVDAKISPFMRKGIIGDWKSHFSAEQNRYIEGLYQEKILPTGLTFEFE